MTKKIILSISLSLIIILTLLVVITYSNDKNPNEISLKEAYSIGVSEVREKWDSNAKLFQLTSIDDSLNDSKGENGKRRYWNFIFAVHNTKNVNSYNT